MSAFEAREKLAHRSFKNNVELTVVEPIKRLVKIVVNNYREPGQEEEVEKNHETRGTMNDWIGLPTQPGGYLKFPTYDWF
jgi:hypothetical protein